MSDARGRGTADLHIHTMASDGTSPLAEILDFVASGTALDVIAITDHERIDAALVARAMARDRGDRFEVIVGEEITTRGGHLLGLFLDRPIRPLRSVRDTVAEVHDQGGLAIAAHPLVPIPLCIGAGTIRRLMADPDPRYHLDALEAFNPTTAGRPWRSRIVRFLAETGLPAVGNSDAHIADAVGTGYTTFPGTTAADLRAALAAGETEAHGRFYTRRDTARMLTRQARKYTRDVRDEIVGAGLRATGRPATGRDLGYPGGRDRPPRPPRAAPPPPSPDDA